MDEDLLNKAAGAFKELCQTIAALRHPETGCPWDLQQTHTSLRKYMIEEAYEAIEVMEPLNHQKLPEELGDVLLQVVLNAQLGLDAKQFSVVDVIHHINAKMLRRHPHVFGERPTGARSDENEVKARWQEIKSKEASQSQEGTQAGLFSHIKPGKTAPSLSTAVAIGKVAQRINFDWQNPFEVLQQVKSELAELESEMASSLENNRAKIYAELGDVFFSLGQLSRHLDIDPEICSHDGNRKFLRRFAKLEAIAKEQGVDIGAASTGVLERLWQEAKATEI